jgi:hypothetical protein
MRADLGHFLPRGCFVTSVRCRAPPPNIRMNIAVSGILDRPVNPRRTSECCLTFEEELVGGEETSFACATPFLDDSDAETRPRMC